VPASGSPTVRRLRLAAELHRLRDRTGLTGDQVADELGWSPSKISRIENARSGLSVSDTRKLLDLYRLEGTHRDELIDLARDASRRGWWEGYSDLPNGLIEIIGMEAEATSAWNWEPQIIPGLLQTEAYAREVISGWQEFAKITPAAIDSRVEARLTRRQRLGDEAPLRLWAVMDESVLSRRFGDNSVMRSQLQHLIDISQLPNVTLKVLSLDGKQPVGTGAFIYFRFPPAYDIVLGDIVWLEQLTTNIPVQQKDEVYQYELAFDELFSKSLPPPRSRDVIADAIKRKWS
jgi:transcriptional regulator with XRE-family HTH domain